MTKRWPSRLTAFLLWTLSALSLAYWWLTLAGVSEQALSADPVASQAPSVTSTDLTRVLGPVAIAPLNRGTALAQPQNPVVQMQLLGIVANRKNVGVALIAVEGQPPRPYRVGSQVAGAYTLSQVSRRSATLSPVQQGAPAITLELASIGVSPALRPTALGGANPASLSPSVPGSNPGLPPVPGARAVLPDSVVDASEPAKD